MYTFRVIGTLRFLACAGACLTLAALTGCGGDSSKATISGKVTYRGAPLTGGILTLYPASGTAYPVPLNADGTFKVSGAPVGTMGVGIATELDPAIPAGSLPSIPVKPVAIPPKYKDPKTSGLTWEIKGGRNAPKDFDLTD
jgi:hypothetical protein